MKVHFTCRYCDYKWREEVYSNPISNKKCEKCKDTNLDVIELDKYRIDSYVGCPPFPVKEEKLRYEDPDWF
jgi:Zn finger protein HypA/HybF involved in hydrogenase expression